jgi:hypothetical protein
MDSIEDDLIHVLKAIEQMTSPEAMAADTNVEHIRRINRIRGLVADALVKVDLHAALRAMGAFNDSTHETQHS